MSPDPKSTKRYFLEYLERSLLTEKRSHDNKSVRLIKRS